VTWLADHWLDVLGWGGSALLIYSLLQASVLRLRVLNLAACLILVVFNAVLGVWPMVAMNVVLAMINLWFVVPMLRQRHDQTVFDVLEIGPADEYLRHVLRVHGADILRFNPDFVHDPGAENEAAFLVQRGDETVGVVLMRREGETAHVLLDYVTPRYRDFSPGEFVWRRSGMLADRGIRRVVTPPRMVGAYYGRLGFTSRGDVWELEVTP
jgi:hypothetical protein